MGYLLDFLSRLLKKASSSVPSHGPSNKKPLALVLHGSDDEDNGSVEASPLQAGLARFSPSPPPRRIRGGQTESAAPLPSPQQRARPSARLPPAVAAAERSSSPSPSRRPFAELSNKVKKEKTNEKENL